MDNMDLLQATGLQQVNDQSGQQCKFLAVHTAFCGVVKQ